MKISKLFHWLYAILMLTPVSAVGITCLTHVFNKEVSEETENATINYMYETNNPQDEFIEGNIYEINANGTYQDFIGDLEENIFDLEIINGSITWQNTTISTADNYPFDENEFNKARTLIQIYNGFMWLAYTNRMGYIQYEFNLESDTSFTINANVVLRNKTIVSDTTCVLLNNLLECPQNEIPIESVDITTNPQDQTTNIFYDSCEQVKDSFVLNWCDYNNPVRAVFDYGSSLFNVNSDNLVNYFLTYWLSISIIWLVFDVFMYVPLLVHRWIDKAKLE